jgi:uncharacterized membrane protein YccF (DUF307 family)
MGIWALLGNILWLVWGSGVICFLFWGLAGLLLCATVVGIPFGIAAFRIAMFSLLPFGNRLTNLEEMGREPIVGTAIANLLWFLLAGLWLAILHVVWGVFHCLTIIGIPFGLAHFKLAAVSLAPLGKRSVLDGVGS